MPSRRDVFENGHIYHIFNKTIDHKNIFLEEKIAQYFLELITYYRSSKADIRYSYFKKLPNDIRNKKEKELWYEKYFKIKIAAYCLMPNHFHLLIMQSKNGGIIRFMADILNALTHYYNQLHQRKGPIFLPQFRSRMITNREYLIHVSRYIHLNPYSSSLLKKIKDLSSYYLCSFHEYSQQTNRTICDRRLILDNFVKGKDSYISFVLNNADYQKTLEYVKYTEKWL